MATNELPYVKTIDDSIKRRFVFLQLKQSFKGKEDVTLIDKIITEKEAIFARAIQ
jgi:phage/plasmid-associated DNA primase